MLTPSASVMAANAKTSVGRRQLVDEVCQRFGEQLGLQTDSVRNQAEHVESLWASFCSRQHDPIEALQDLREQLLRTHRVWHSKVWPRLFHGPVDGAASDSDSSVGSAVLDRAGPLLDDGAGAAARERDSSPIEDVCLFLLLWGEMGNLRFCPELHCFLFSAARSFCAVRAGGLANAEARPTNDFLEGVVKPIFQAFTAETFTPGSPPRPKYGSAPAPPTAANYDDWNELFWDADRLKNGLRMPPSGGHPNGFRIVDAAGQPSELWDFLSKVDWARTLAGQKSHKEYHSFFVVMVGCYRIFLLQSFLLGVLLINFEARRESRHGPGEWVDFCGLMLVVPFWMALHEIGYLFVTPTASWKQRFSGLCKLVVMYASPVASFLLVLYAIRDGWHPLDFLTANAWHSIVLTIHFIVSGMAFLVALAPQKAKLNGVDFAPQVDNWRGFGPYAFWIVVLIAATCFNSSLVKAWGEALYGLWMYHRASETDWQNRLIVIMECAALFAPSGICFCASFLFFMNFSIAVVGAVLGVVRLGGFKLFWYRRGLGFMRVPLDLCRRVLQPAAETKRASLSDRMQEPLKAMRWWKRMTEVELQAFLQVWHETIDDLRKRDLITDAERAELSFGPDAAQAARRGQVPRLLDPADVFNIENSLPCGSEARRRLVALARAVTQHTLPSAFVRSSPSLSVLIPHYAEDICYTRASLFPDNEPSELLRFLVEYYREEFVNFVERAAGDIGGGAEDAERGRGHASLRRLPADIEARLCEWASLRMQTLWRTVEGICASYSGALQAVARVQEPNLSEESQHAMVKDKFQVVLAMQKYAHFSDMKKGANPEMLAAVEAMLAAFSPWLRIAFIEEEDGPQGRRYFSSLIDASCPLVREPGRLPSRRPRLRVELPGFPILGHGKSDNQNCAMIFTRGEILQMIDCNQEAYFESALFLPTALQEFGTLRGGRRPGILGFREHIFSDIGLLGRIAADSEFAFGTIIQRTMDWPMEARLHYGHPDMMDKLQVLQQGGVSKATRGLNLSEDVFAGLDLTLRGGWTTYKEYFHVGKGRDMGFMSVLGFFSKVSMGNGEQAITRQWLRLAMGLPLPRFLGIYFTHIGFFLNQCLVNWATKAFAFVAAYFAVASRLDIGADDAAVGTAVGYFGIFYLLFLLSTVVPLLLEVYIELGFVAALSSLASSFFALSPVFAAFQSKLMGHYFWSTLHYGGAQYIATGRGLATMREPFTRLFRTFSPTHMKDGFELMLFLMFSAGTDYGPGFYMCTLFSMFSWMIAPFLFNPRQFDVLHRASDDFVSWWRWMSNAEGGEEESWAAWAIRVQEVRKSSSLLVELTPSARPMALLCTMLTVLSGPPYRAICTNNFMLVVTLAPPGVLHFLLCLVMSKRANSTAAGKQVTHYPFLALMAIALFLLEMGLLPWYENTWRLVLFHKYMWARFLLEVFDGVAVRQPGGSMLASVHGACRLWALSWRFIRDVILGGFLNAMVLFIAALPGARRCHSVFLFRARLQKDKAEATEAPVSPAYDCAAGSDSDSEDGSVSTLNPSTSEAIDPLAMWVRQHAIAKRRILRRLRRRR